MSECWIPMTWGRWMTEPARDLATLPGGHTLTRFFGGRGYTHRETWKALHGREPNGDLHHACENPQCCNPDHLVEMSRSEHLIEHRGTTHCPQGHEYAGANLIINSVTGRSQCRACLNAQKRARRAAANGK